MSDSVEFDKVTLRALRSNTINKISDSLNPLKVLPAEEGLLRDWRGLAQLAGLDGNTVSSLKFKPDPTAEVLKLWTKDTCTNEASIGLLRSFLSRIDRWDIVDDLADMFEQDVHIFNTRVNNARTSDAQIIISADKHILTVDDVDRIENGLLPQSYDAFLLFAEEDSDFAMQIVDKMENEYGLKLCIRDRDLVGGLAFEHDAIMKLIAKRCNRLIVVVSPNFLRSEANKFFVTFAQALGIEQRQRKVVPCLYQRCKLPPELSYYFLLDFNRVGKLWNVWEKLRDSIQAPSLMTSYRPDQAHQNLKAVDFGGPSLYHRNDSACLHSNDEYKSLVAERRDPPPPYSPPVTSPPLGLCSSETNISLSAPNYGSPDSLGLTRAIKRSAMSSSTSESNLVMEYVEVDPHKVSETLTNELKDHSQFQVLKDKAKPLQWLRRFIPKDKKRCHKRVVEA